MLLAKLTHPITIRMGVFVKKERIITIPLRP